MSWSEVTIIRVTQETAVDRTFHLALPTDHAPFECIPGQYVVLRDPTEDPERDWYFSLSGSPGADGQLQITVRGRGDAVRRIYDAQEGSRWRVQPPAGTFHVAAPAGTPVVMAAAGSGVTPFRAFLEARRRENESAPLWLFHSAREPAELLFAAEFNAWSESWDAFTYVPTVTKESADWDGRQGRIDADALTPALSDPATTRVYACGPAGFVEAMLATAETLGVPEEQRLRERW